MKNNKNKTIILCAGQHGRAVLVGTVDADPTPGEPVTLRDARMIVYWARECGGLFGLAAKGPAGATRITHAAPQTTETVWQEWIECTPAAAAAIAEWPAWQG